MRKGGEMDMVLDDIQRFDSLSSVRDLDCSASRSFLGGILRRVPQILCGLTGHNELLHFERARLSLYCLRCGDQSAGWEVGTTRVGVVAKRDGFPSFLRSREGSRPVPTPDI